MIRSLYRWDDFVGLLGTNEDELYMFGRRWLERADRRAEIKSDTSTETQLVRLKLTGFDQILCSDSSDVIDGTGLEVTEEHAEYPCSTTDGDTEVR